MQKTLETFYTLHPSITFDTNTKDEDKYKYIPRPDTNIKLQIQVQALAMQRIAAKPSVGKTD